MPSYRPISIGSTHTKPSTRQRRVSSQTYPLLTLPSLFMLMAGSLHYRAACETHQHHRLRAGLHPQRARLPLFRSFRPSESQVKRWSELNQKSRKSISRNHWKSFLVRWNRIPMTRYRLSRPIHSLPVLLGVLIALGGSHELCGSADSHSWLRHRSSSKTSKWVCVCGGHGPLPHVRRPDEHWVKTVYSYFNRALLLDKNHPNTLFHYANFLRSFLNPSLLSPPLSFLPLSPFPLSPLSPSLLSPSFSYRSHMLDIGVMSSIRLNTIM